MGILILIQTSSPFRDVLKLSKSYGIVQLAYTYNFGLIIRGGFWEISLCYDVTH